MPRSGTTLVFEAVAAHEDLAWLSQHVQRAPRFPAVAALSRLTGATHHMRRSVGRSDQLRPSLERLRIGPVEAYGFWEDCCGEKFRYDYLLGVEASPEEREEVRSRISRVMRYHGKSRFAAKVTGPGRIAYLTSIFPHAHFVHVVRDGRAVVNSLMRVGFWRDRDRMNRPAWRNGLTAKDLEDWNRYDRSPLALAAVQWRRVIETTRAEAERVAADRFGEIHYERFVRDPHAVLEAVLRFCELPPSSSPGRFLDARFELRDMNVQWRNDLDADEVELLNELIGPALAAAGYSPDPRASPGPMPALRRPFSTTHPAIEARAASTKASPVVTSNGESRTDATVGLRVAGRRGYPGFFSSAKTFALPAGSNVSAGRLRGYYIDFSLKADEPDWPPRWFNPSARHVASIQWGLGCFERYLNGDGERWLAAVIKTAEYLVGIQVPGGAREGGWLHNTPMPHTYRLDVPWLSGMAQGEGASLLVRAHQVTGEERFADAARRALRPLTIPVAEGGVHAQLDGSGFFPEEYPTDPPSFVLNGGIFALWGHYDVAVALDVPEVRQEFERGVDTLARNIDRWDTGSWSRYDLFPHRVVNVASSSYHVLHINQLRAMQLVCPRKELEAAARRFEGYWTSRANRVPAFARKAMFRLLVPRNRLLARMSLAGRRDERETAA